MKPKHFSSRHSHVTIKPPSDKALDLEDEYDMQQAKKKLYSEWLTIQEDIDAFFNVVKLPIPKMVDKIQAKYDEINDEFIHRSELSEWATVSYVYANGQWRKEKQLTGSTAQVYASTATNTWQNDH